MALPDNVVQLHQDVALSCDCGCVSWYYLKSNKVRCIQCGQEIEVKHLMDEIRTGNYD